MQGNKDLVPRESSHIQQDHKDEVIKEEEQSGRVERSIEGVEQSQARLSIMPESTEPIELEANYR